MPTAPHDVPDERPLLIGIGELLWDCFPNGRRPGGAPANVAFHANQLGLRGIICSRIGDDALGHELGNYLRDRGVDTSFLQRDARRPTSTVDVHDTGDGPAYTIHEDVAWDDLEPLPSWGAAFDACAAVCFGTLAQRSEQSRRTIWHGLERARDAHCIYDVNLRPPFYRAEWIARSLERADVLKLNGDELPTLAELLRLSAEEPGARAAELCARYDLRLVCMTRGAQGAALFTPATQIDIPGQSVQVADTVGAGDAFTAALAAGLIWDWPLERIGHFANEVAGHVAGRHGAMPDLADEFADLVARYRGGA